MDCVTYRGCTGMTDVKYLHNRAYDDLIVFIFGRETRGVGCEGSEILG